MPIGNLSELDNGHLGPLIYETPNMTTDEIQRHLLPAQGWIELGDWQSANDELEKVEPQQRVHPYVLELRWQVYALAGKWDVAVELAGKLMEAGIPDCAERAFKVACHACRLNHIEDARKWVEKACELGGKKMKQQVLNEPKLEQVWY